MVSHEDIRGIARSLPGTFERESYGGRTSWRTSARMFAWIRDDPEALVVWVSSLEDKEALIAADPGKFFSTSHYVGQPIVLVRLEEVELDEVRELVTDSWLVRAPLLNGVYPSRTRRLVVPEDQNSGPNRHGLQG